MTGAMAPQSPGRRSGPGRRAARSCNQRSTGEIEEGEEEGARRERDREPENNLDQSAHAAGSLTKRERKARANDNDDRKNLGHGALDAVEDLRQRLLPRHVRA